VKLLTFIKNPGIDYQSQFISKQTGGKEHAGSL